MTKIAMTALQSITASQSPTGLQIRRGEAYEASDETLASSHERRGLGRRSEVAEAKPAKRPAQS